MTAYSVPCTLVVCCQDGYRTEVQIRPETREEPQGSVAQLHLLIEQPTTQTPEGIRTSVGLSREACRELGRALLRYGTRR